MSKISAPVCYVEGFVSDPDRAFESLKTIAWERREDAPRFEYYCNDLDRPYTYGQGRGVRTYYRRELPAVAKDIRDHLESYADCSFEVCFLNRYKDSHDHLGWHADDSPEMDPERPIAVVSLGEEREIWFRLKGTTEVRKLTLRHGSLCLMAPCMQQRWEHRIPKASFQAGERISLTYRGFVADISPHQALWDAINNYTLACGGDTSGATITSRRMDAVSAVEKAVQRLQR